MPDSMIERMARAAYLAVQHDGNIRWEWDDAAYARVRQTYVTAAKAQLASMREPTEAMWQAGMAACGGDGQFLDGYEAMIDAALAEEG